MLVVLGCDKGDIVYDDIIQAQITKKSVLLVRRLSPQVPLALDISSERKEHGKNYGYLNWIKMYGVGYDRYIRTQPLPEDQAGQGV